MALHMVVMDHTPESCGHRNSENRTAFGDGFQQLARSVANHRASIAGAWINSGAHRHFLLIDAPDAHTVNAILGESGLLSRATSKVTAVDDFAGALVPTGS